MKSVTSSGRNCRTLVCQLGAIHAGHHDAGEQHVDLGLLVRRDMLSGDGTVSFQYAISTHLQRYTRYLPHRRLILHQQDGGGTNWVHRLDCVPFRIVSLSMVGFIVALSGFAFSLLLQAFRCKHTNI